jgi:hypothetical protein
VTDDENVAVWVTEVRYTGGTVAYGRGEDEDGERVDFWGEPRALHAIAEALENGDGPVLAAVPTWAMHRLPVHLRPGERAAIVEAVADATERAVLAALSPDPAA